MNNNNNLLRSSAPRLEGPQSIPSFNRLIKCTRHGKMCTMVCMSPKCPDRTLCHECIVEHTHSHLSKVIPLKEFNEQTNVVPTLVQREIIQVRSQIFSLQNQLLTAREARKKEFRSIISSAKDIFRQEIEILEKEGIQLLERYFNKHTDQMSQQLYTIQSHLNTLQPYMAINSSAMPVQSSNINNIITYQEALISDIIPQLNQSLKSLTANVLHTDIYLNNQAFLNKLTRNLTENLNIRHIFTQKDPIQMKKDREEIERIQKGTPEPFLFDLQMNTSKLIENIDKGPIFRIPKQLLQADIKVEDFEPKEDSEFMKVFTNHTDVVSCLCFMDNTRFASAGGDKTIKVWNLDSGYQLASMQGHLMDIWALARINSITLASASSDKTIRLWNLEEISCFKVLNGLYSLFNQGHSDVVKCLCFCGDRQLLASGCVDSRIKLWNTNGGDLKNTLSIHQGMVRSMVYIETKGLLVSASSDNLIKATKIDNSMRVASVLTGHYGEVQCVIYLYDRGDDSFIASGGQDKVLIIWNVDKAIQVKQFRSHYNTITSVTYCQKHEVIITGSSDKQIIVWDQRGVIKNRIKLHSDLVSSLAYSERRNILLSGSWDHHIYAVTLKLYDDGQFA